MPTTASEMSEERFKRNMLHYCFQFYLLFIPLEYKDAVRFQHSHKLTEPIPNVFSPVGRQETIIFCNITIVSCPPEMWRVEQNKMKMIVREGNMTEVCNDIRINLYSPSI